MNLASLLAGLGLGISLIAAIGAQNAFLLRQGAKREHLALVLAICIASDVALIAAGVAGIGAALDHAPWLTELLRWGGAAFLIAYGLMAAWRALRPGPGRALDAADRPAAAARSVPPAPPTSTASADPRDPGAVATALATAVAPPAARRRSSATAVALTTLALTWLNPHVYLDSVVLLGTAAAAHGDDRWSFAVGAVAASVVWFIAVGLGARALGPLLRTPTAWRVLDAGVAAIMLALGVGLAVRGL